MIMRKTFFEWNVSNVLAERFFNCSFDLWVRLKMKDKIQLKWIFWPLNNMMNFLFSILILVWNVNYESHIRVIQNSKVFSYIFQKQFRLALLHKILFHNIWEFYIALVQFPFTKGNLVSSIRIFTYKFPYELPND